MKGTLFEEMEVVDGAGMPVTDGGMMGVARCLIVAECCARFLEQVDGLGMEDQAKIDHFTDLLAINVIRATASEGCKLAGDVRRTAVMLGFDLHIVQWVMDAGRMDS